MPIVDLQEYPVITANMAGGEGEVKFYPYKMVGWSGVGGGGGWAGGGGGGSPRPPCN